MRIYIAGPITGVMNYRQNFKRVESNMKSKGHIVINPSFLPDGLINYMEICKKMIEQSDSVYFLIGSDKSVGALEEFKYSKSLNLKIYYETKELEECMNLIEK